MITFGYNIQQQKLNNDVANANRDQRLISKKNQNTRSIRRTPAQT